MVLIFVVSIKGEFGRTLSRQGKLGFSSNTFYHGRLLLQGFLKLILISVSNNITWIDIFLMVSLCGFI